LAQVPGSGLNIAQARTALLRIKAADDPTFSFIPDDHDVSNLPGWVKTPKQTTDGHLARLAISHGAVLATLDTKIPEAYVIPSR
jgi:hypothetical protein